MGRLKPYSMGLLKRKPMSSSAILAMSSLDNDHEVMSWLETMRASLEDLGMTAIPFSTDQRSRTWAGVLLLALAIETMTSCSRRGAAERAWLTPRGTKEAGPKEL